MNVLILGGDGYLGWPTAMDLASKGHSIHIVDNYLRRKMAAESDSLPLFNAPDMAGRTAVFEEVTGNRITFSEADCSDYQELYKIVKEFKPNAIIHYAEQPSAPYSMRGFSEAKLTLENNLATTFNVIWACIELEPDCHIVKLGTMGEYGTPNIDIEEGWLDVTHNGREQRFLYPRQAGSLYHTTKVLDTDLLWFYVRTYGLRVTDLMQGPVYGILTDQAALDDQLLPNFHYDDIFGTVVNRFLVQAVAGVPLTIFGAGGQTRGYLNLKDTLQCIDLALKTPACSGELRVLNQFTETFSVSELAEKVVSAARLCGLSVNVENIDNPRKELENHYYNPKHSGLSDLGLVPNLMTDEVLAEMITKVKQNEEKIVKSRIYPRVTWS